MARFVDALVVPQRLGRGITRCYMRASFSNSGQPFTQLWGPRYGQLALALGALAATTAAKA